MAKKESTKGSNRSRKQVKSSKQRSPQAQLTVVEHNWGSLFTGTKAQIIAAGLATFAHFLTHLTTGVKDKKYWLPLDWQERYNDACFGSRAEPIPPRWDAVLAKALGDDTKYSVWASYNVDRDMAVRPRAEQAIRALRAALDLVEDIAPTPISEQLGLTVQPVQEGGANG